MSDIVERLRRQSNVRGTAVADAADEIERLHAVERLLREQKALIHAEEEILRAENAKLRAEMAQFDKRAPSNPPVVGEVWWQRCEIVHRQLPDWSGEE